MGLGALYFLSKNQFDYVNVGPRTSMDVLNYRKYCCV